MNGSMKAEPAASTTAEHRPNQVRSTVAALSKQLLVEAALLVLLARAAGARIVAANLLVVADDRFGRLVVEARCRDPSSNSSPRSSSQQSASAFVRRRSRSRRGTPISHVPCTRHVETRRRGWSLPARRRTRESRASSILQATAKLRELPRTSGFFSLRQDELAGRLDRLGREISSRPIESGIPAPLRLAPG